ncbi:putative maleylacetoacetate isomerase 2 [Dissophora ornata]|nr:Glutathione S-transferase zeta-1 [Dissophora ornata]KAI8597676.1 putative maleylacetoacetate isomerase 2 [Dissophora ornata]
MSDRNLPVLYSYWRSSCAWRVRLALGLKNITYVTRPIDLSKGENRTPEFLKIQPFGTVPAFVDNIGDKKAIAESVAILEYLDETRPENPLLPKDPADRAVVRSLVFGIGMSIQPLCSNRVIKYIGKDKEQEWSHHFLTEGFAALEKLLERAAGKYAFGDSLTLADIALVPQFYNGVRSGVDMKAYPTMYRINSTLEQLDVFKAAHPTKQLDCPPEFR